MDRWRAAGALLALAACIASTAAAPTAGNQTALDLYEGSAEGCYYNFQHYGEGDRIMTNEPCLNCTCHNRMLMCYLRVCPFTKAIGQDCTVEKRADQCCPIVTCPDVPVDLLTSTSTTSPAEYGATGLGKLDKYGCSIKGKYFPEGSKVPPTPNKPCEHCYCIRNMTTCVMQECTLHVDGCTPIYHKDVCCPVRYSCDHPEDEVPLLDDMSTTVRPTPGFLLTTTTVAPVTQMTQDCVHEDKIFADGALIKTEKACEHCYCMKGDIVCVVQECGAPMENEGKNCTSLPPREGQCCPDTYICEGDELTSDIPTESTTEAIIEKLTTLIPPRRTGVEGSGYRNEPDEAPYTDMPTIEPEVEGSGEEQETSKPLGPDEIIPEPEDGEQYMYVSTKAPVSEEHDRTTEINLNVSPEIDEKTEKIQNYPTTSSAPPKEEVEKYTTSGISEEEILEVHEHVPTTSAPESFEKATTELGEALNTVPDVIPEEELDKSHYTPSTTETALEKESESPMKESEKIKPPKKDQEITDSSLHDYTTPISISSNEIEKEVSTSAETLNVTPEVIVEKDLTETDIIGTTIATVMRESERPDSEESGEDNERSTPEQFAPSTTSYPVDENHKITMEPDHAENTVAVAEEETTHPHLHIPMTTIALPSIEEEERTTVSSPEENIVTDKVIKDNVYEPHENIPTESSALDDSELTTTKSNMEINTVPNVIDEKTSSEELLPQRTTLSDETKATESSIVTGEMQTHEMKPTPVSEMATPLPESMITKGDQYTITTEPSFRKEDDSSVSTEKPKDFVSSTDRSEFVDEGLIPTSDHDEKTSSDVPSTEEEFTTSVPAEYITTPSILETSVDNENLPSEVSKPSSEQYGEVSLSTVKIADVTASVGDNVETTEEPSRIPGEGDCLLNGVTYRNNSIVPSTNNCHSGCRCASSIIKCDPIICSPPPDYMDNCQSIYDSPDSCCPTYVCDHPRETVPPQSDNQMSGTESPMPTPTIECRGDQCEITEPAKQPPELCSSGSCLSEDHHKPHIECGSEGCGELAQVPEQTLPSVEKADDCKDGKCKPDSCANGDCQLPETPIQVSPVRPCEGDQCEPAQEVTQPSSPQLCKNEEDCKSVNVPVVETTACQGESDCISDELPHVSQPVQCKDEDGCEPQNIPVPDCTGDEPCRRKEVTPSIEKLPTECEGSNCEHKPDTIDVNKSSTQLPYEEVTEKAVVPTLEEQPTELPESPISTGDKVEEIPAKDTKETSTYTTESLIDEAITEIDTKKPSVVEGKPTKKPTIQEEDRTEAPIALDKSDETTVESENTYPERDATESPAIIEKETNKPAVLIQEGENKPIDTEEKSTEKPTIVEISTGGPTLVDDENKEKPTIGEKESTEKTTTVEKEDTELPTDSGESTEKSTTVDDEAKEKPVLVDEKEPVVEGTKEPVTVEEADASKPNIFDGETTDIPAITEKESTEVPAVPEEKETDKPTLVHEVDKEKPTTIDEEGTEKPVIIGESTESPVMDSDEGKDKPTLIDENDMDTKKHPAGEELTGEPVKEITTDKLIEREGTEQPVIISEDEEGKPTATDEKPIKRPDYLEENESTKPDINDDERITSGVALTTEETNVIEDNDTKKPVADEEGKEKPNISGVDDVGNEVEKQKPVSDNESTEKPITEEDIKKTSTVVEQEITEHPILIDEERTEIPFDEEKPETSTVIVEKVPETPTVTIEDGSVKPDLDDGEKSSESPSILAEEGTEEPIIIEEKYTEKPTIVGQYDNGTEKPLIAEGEKEKPIIIDEEIEEKPDVVDKDSKVTEEDNTRKPDILEGEDKIKPSITEEERTDIPTVTVEESTDKPAVIEKEDAIKPVYIEREGTELPVTIEEDNTEKPSLVHEAHPEKPTKFDEEDIKEPTVIEKEGTKAPISFEKDSTDQPATDEEKYTKEPSFIEKESTDIPTTVKEAHTDKPLMNEEDGVTPSIERDGTDEPMVDEEKDKEKPILIDEEMKEKPSVTEVQATENPEEGSGILIPEVHTDEPEKEVMVTEIIAQTTEATMSKLEEITKPPVYEPQTTSSKDIEYAYTTELNTAEPFEKSTSPQKIIPSETPDVKETEVEDSDSKPVISEHSSTPEIVTGSIPEQEFTTKIPLHATASGEDISSIPDKEIVSVSSISDSDVQTTNPSVDTDTKEVSGTNGQDGTSDEEMHSTKMPELNELTEPTDKTTESSQASETPTTKGPGVSLTEPQEESKRPDLPITGGTEEESTTKLDEQEKIKPIPESQVTVVPPEQPGSEVPEMKDKDKKEPESGPDTEPGQDITEPEKITTQIPGEEDIKTDHIFNPDKEAITTEIPAFSVTEPVRRFTEVEDSSITGQEDIVTGYPEKSTEHPEPSATENENLGITPTSSDTEQPLFTDTESPKLTEETSGFDKPSEGQKEKPEISDSTATDIPISVVTETHEISHTSQKDVTSYEEKSTSIPDISEAYTEKQKTSTEIPEYHVTVSQEFSETPQSYTTDQHAIGQQETSTKPEEKDGTQLTTTDIPQTSVKEEGAETEAPEIMYSEPHTADENKPSVTEMQKHSTELPTLEDVQTELQGVHVTSEAPQSLVTDYQEATVVKGDSTPKPELVTTQSEEIIKTTELHTSEQEELQTESPIRVTDFVELTTKATKLDITEPDVEITTVPEDDVTEKLTTLREKPVTVQEITESPDSDTKVPEVTTLKQIEEGMQSTEYSSPQAEFSETTPYLIELEEHTHKIVGDISTIAPFEEDHKHKPVEDISTSSPSAEEHTSKIEEHPSTILPFEEKLTTLHPEAGQEPQISEVTTKAGDEEIGTTTEKSEATGKPSEELSPEHVSDKITESLPIEGTTQAAVHHIDDKYTVDDKEYTTSAPIQISEVSTPVIVTDSEKIPISESSDVAVPTEKETSSSEKPLHPTISQEVTAPEEEFIASTSKTTTVRQEEEPTSDDKLAKPEEVPTKTSEVPVSSTTEVSKPIVPDMQPTDEIPAPEEEGHFPPSGTSGYGEPEPDYVEEDQAFGPGTCRYGGKVYVSAQQIPRDDPCDFCFCFRSDIICLQQSCPPPIHGCHEEPIQGFCCPRYECPVSMATTVNVTTTTTTTTTTLPPHFPTHSYKGAAQRRGCQIKGHTYKVGEVVRSSSGPCLHCTCGGDGQMKCDPKACTPEPMLRQMIAAAVSAKRRR